MSYCSRPTTNAVVYKFQQNSQILNNSDQVLCYHDDTERSDTMKMHHDPKDINAHSSIADVAVPSSFPAMSSKLLFIAAIFLLSSQLLRIIICALFRMPAFYFSIIETVFAIRLLHLYISARKNKNLGYTINGIRFAAKLGIFFSTAALILGVLSMVDYLINTLPAMLNADPHSGLEGFAYAIAKLYSQLFIYCFVIPVTFMSIIRLSFLYRYILRFTRDLSNRNENSSLRAKPLTYTLFIYGLLQFLVHTAFIIYFMYIYMESAAYVDPQIVCLFLYLITAVLSCAGIYTVAFWLYKYF